MKETFSLRDNTINFSVDTLEAHEVEAIASALGISEDAVKSMAENATANIAYRAVGKIKKAGKAHFTFEEFMLLGVTAIRSGEPVAEDKKKASAMLEAARKQHEKAADAWQAIFSAAEGAAKKYGFDLPTDDDGDYTPDLDWLAAVCRLSRLAKARAEKAAIDF